MLKKYQSITRHGKTGTEATVQGNPYIYIQEKLDGANASFTVEDGEIKCFSRNTELDENNTLRGFYEWVHKNVDKELLLSGYIYYGEWLVSHKIKYDEQSYKNFYLFDVYDKMWGRYINYEMVESIAGILNLDLVPLFYRGEFQSLEHIQSFIGKSKLGEQGKGVVVKNYDFKNKHGDQMFTKFVSDHFTEVADRKKHTVRKEPLQEFIDSTLTEARVSKLLHKLVDEGKINEDYAIEDMGKILKSLGSSVYDDIIKEEQDELLKIVRGKIGKQTPNVIKQILQKEGRM